MVALEKEVEVSNPRLSALNWLIGLITFTAFIGGAYFLDMIYIFIPMSDNIQLNLWPYGTQAKFFQQVEDGHKRSLNSALCKESSEYDFVFDADGTRKYRMQSCMNLCEVWQRHEDCISIHDIAEQPAKNEIVFLTAVQDVDLHTVSGKNTTTSSFVSWDLSDLGIWISYGFTVADQSWTPSTVGDRRDYFKASSGTNILTVVTGTDAETGGRKVIEVRDPTQDQIFTVRELLDFAGATDRLDSHEYAGATRNYLAGAEKKTGPIGRIKGIDLRMKVECFQDDKQLWSGRDWEGPICYVSVDAPSASWVSLEKSERVDVHRHRLRTSHGIRVTVLGGGVFMYPSVERLCRILIQFLVVMRFPATVVSIIVCYCLGTFSLVFRKVLKTRFNFAHETAGIVSRTLARALHFNQLEESSSGIGGISQNEIHKLVRSAMSHEHYKAHDHELQGKRRDLLANVVSFCYQGMQDVNQGDRSMIETLRDAVENTWDESQDRISGRIGSSQFQAASSSVEIIDLDDITTMFGRSRRVPLVETAFTPAMVRVFRQNVQDKDEEAPVTQKTNRQKANASSRWDETTQGLRALTQKVTALEADASAAAAVHEIITEADNFSIARGDSESDLMELDGDTFELGNAFAAMDLAASMGLSTMEQVDELNLILDRYLMADLSPAGSEARQSVARQSVEAVDTSPPQDTHSEQPRHSKAHRRTELSEEHLRRQMREPLDELQTGSVDHRRRVEGLLEGARAREIGVDANLMQLRSLRDVLVTLESRLVAVEQFVSLDEAKASDSASALSSLPTPRDSLSAATHVDARSAATHEDSGSGVANRTSFNPSQAL